MRRDEGCDDEGSNNTRLLVLWAGPALIDATPKHNDTAGAAAAALLGDSRSEMEGLGRYLIKWYASPEKEGHTSDPKTQLLAYIDIFVAAYFLLFAII